MAYLSPDRIAGRPATPLDDLYAVGAIGYEALTGRMPFPQADPVALMRAIAQHDLPPLATVRPDVDPTLAAVIDRAMTPNPAQRFPHADAMRSALSSRRPPTLVLAAPPMMAGPPSTGAVPPPSRLGRRRRTWAAFAAAAAVLLALVLVLVESIGSQSEGSQIPTTSAPSATTSVAPPTTSVAPPTTVETFREGPGNGHRNGGPKKPKHGENG